MPLMAARYTIELHPRLFQIPRQVWNQYTEDALDSTLVGLLMTPIPMRIELITPSVEKRENAREYTMTQLIKFGNVVMLWTNFEYPLWGTSFRRMANTSGSGITIRFRTAKVSVFLMTLHMSTVSRKNCLKYFNPTKFSADREEPGVYWKKEMLQPNSGT